ncbi:VOC family protein [Gimesia fumaroli]|uniref:Glyoxalase-like domain protein n=1 Tax=Gimesia fumaroli TaxID=2527976 RepID=A0A518I8Y4_9PLAN|nr:VOC family protein [Gimesia fumaroli]QDV49509.1 Glyoxalase-like domain protein [Gimesia fumaroli]
MNTSLGKPAEKPIPDGMHTLTPHLICVGANEAIEFYKNAFGAIEQMRLPGPDGKLMYACLQIGDSQIMLTEENENCGSRGPKTLQGSPVTLHLQVEDADAMIEQAVAAGVTLLMPATDMFWGDRYGQVEDPFGHRWAVATHVRDLNMDEIQSGMQAMFENT